METIEKLQEKIERLKETNRKLRMEKELKEQAQEINKNLRIKLHQTKKEMQKEINLYKKLYNQTNKTLIKLQDKINVKNCYI